MHPTNCLEDTPILELLSLKGKTAVISGASTGIGFAVAEAYAQAGANLCVWYNSNDPSTEFAQLATKYSVKISVHRVPVTDPEVVKHAIEQHAAEFGFIDIFVANAGIAWHAGALIDQQNNNEWENVMNVDLDGCYYCALYIGKLFKQQGHGSLIFTGSVSARLVNVPQKQACYNAAKAAVVHLSKSLAVEWAAFARVNSISPGFIKTPILDYAPQEMQDVWWKIVPMGRAALPKEVVGAYLYLASDASTYTTGCDLVVDGGYTLP